MAGQMSATERRVLTNKPAETLKLLAESDDRPVRRHGDMKMVVVTLRVVAGMQQLDDAAALEPGGRTEVQLVERVPADLLDRLAVDDILAALKQRRHRITQTARPC